VLGIEVISGLLLRGLEFTVSTSFYVVFTIMSSNTPFFPYRGIMPTINPHAFVAQTAAVIGDVHLGAGSGIWYGCVVRGDVNEIRIGQRTNIQDLTMIHCAERGQGTYLGDGITVGHSAVLHACTIEDNAFIGIQACVMDDCLVETGAMVAAGALVTPGKIVKAGEVWAGQPAKKLRDITQKDLDFFDINRQRYERLADEYRNEQT
jgi:carbonic anhydrase/acetyltransferase-like protein (isoleucine patch superfamily)